VSEKRVRCWSIGSETARPIVIMTSQRGQGRNKGWEPREWSRLCEYANWCHGFTPSRLTLAATRKRQDGSWIPRTCAVKAHVYWWSSGVHYQRHQAWNSSGQARGISLPIHTFFVS